VIEKYLIIAIDNFLARPSALQYIYNAHKKIKNCKNVMNF